MTTLFFAKNLKYLRECKGLKQYEMLTYIGFETTRWNNYEKGKSFPKFEDFLKISKKFDVSLDLLVYSDLSNTHNLGKMRNEENEENTHKNTHIYTHKEAKEMVFGDEDVGGRALGKEMVEDATDKLQMMEKLLAEKDKQIEDLRRFNELLERVNYQYQRRIEEMETPIKQAG